MLVLLAIAACSIYVLPNVSGVMGRWALPGSVILMSFIVILPMLSLIHKMNYMASLFSWIVTIVVVGIIVGLAGAGFDMSRNFQKSAQGAAERKEGVEEYLNLLAQ
jgi:hypothetical protein